MARAAACCHDPTVKTVLIVDDHLSFRSTARTVLEAEGFRVIGEAGDGAEAVELTKRLHPDVVLLDVQLPDMDGFEIASLLSANGQVPAIVLTSSRDAGEFGSLIDRSPVRGFVPKAELSGRRLAALLE